MSVWMSVIVNLISKKFFTKPRQKKAWERYLEEQEELERQGLVNNDEQENVREVEMADLRDNRDHQD